MVDYRNIAPRASRLRLTPWRTFVIVTVSFIAAFILATFSVYAIAKANVVFDSAGHSLVDTRWEQVALLFLVVFGGLWLGSIASYYLRRRKRLRYQDLRV